MLDKKLILGLAQDMKGNNATTATTNVIDLGANATNKLGKGTKLIMRMVVTTAAANGTSVQGGLYHCANNNQADSVALITGPVVAVANAGAGAVILEAALPAEHLRWINGKVVTVGNVTACNVTTYIDIVP